MAILAMIEHGQDARGTLRAASAAGRGSCPAAEITPSPTLSGLPACNTAIPRLYSWYENRRFHSR
jgi:hypothetical protein